MKIAKINSLKNVGILDEMTYKKEFTLYKTEIKDGKTIYNYLGEKQEIQVSVKRG